MKKVVLQVIWAILSPFITLIVCRNFWVLTTNLMYVLFFISLLVAQWVAILVWEINEISEYLKKK